ncbi:uncharacterized protein LOC133800154 [Humulus lupulus]|uniref:uncharacterized protein LOC133800154 n=1 Tax=Humulus lupulus TaxID=3486 RepID=UPI002B4139E2|nr:uncharacterized protein LOC133800154 [Humulus lupulus]
MAWAYTVALQFADSSSNLFASTAERDCLTDRVFMDDFSVYGDSFDKCHHNLTLVLQCCIETNIVLNWGKCHFMVNQGIVLGHVISVKSIEVDKAKINLIRSLPPPTSMGEVRYFLGHAGFYRRLIKVFSKIATPLCNLLQKDVVFKFDEKCLVAFNRLKDTLISAPVIQPPNWELPFEIMCDLPEDFTQAQRNKLKHDVKQYVWNEPYLWKHYVDQYHSQGDESYHPQANGQTSIGMSLFRLVYGKPCHLLVELEHEAWWVVKQCNTEMDAAGQQKKLQLQELEEIRNDAYDSSKIYKEKTKAFHDKRISRKSFMVGQKVLLYHSRVKLFPRNLRSRWMGPCVVTIISPNGSIEISSIKMGKAFTMNGQRLKPYYESFEKKRR